VNVGPFLKAFGTEYLPVKHTSGLIFLQFRSSRDGIDFEFYQEVCKWAGICCKFSLHR
jgi:hypothetical protein